MRPDTRKADSAPIKGSEAVHYKRELSCLGEWPLIDIAHLFCLQFYQGKASGMAYAVPLVQDHRVGVANQSENTGFLVTAGVECYEKAPSGVWPGIIFRGFPTRHIYSPVG